MASRQSTRRAAAPPAGSGGHPSARCSWSVSDLPGSFLSALAEACTKSSRLCLRCTCRCLREIVDSTTSTALTLRLHTRKPSLMLLQQHGLLQNIVVLDTAAASKGTVSIGCPAPFPGLSNALPRLRQARLNNSQGSLVELLVTSARQLSHVSLAVISSTPTVVRQLSELSHLVSLHLSLSAPSWIRACAGLGNLGGLQELVIAGKPLDEASKHGIGSISSTFWECNIAQLTRLTSLSANPWIKAMPDAGPVTYSTLVNLRRLCVPYASGKTLPHGTAALLQQLGAHCTCLTSLTVGVHEFGWDVSDLSGLSQLRELDIHNPFLKDTWGLQPFTAAHLAPLTALTQLTGLTISTLRLPSMMDLMQAAAAAQQQQQQQQQQPPLPPQAPVLVLVPPQQQQPLGFGLGAAGPLLAAPAGPNNNNNNNNGNNNGPGFGQPGPAGALAAALQAAGVPGLQNVNAVVVAALQAAAADPQLLDAPLANNAAAIAAVQAAAAAVAALAAPLAAMLQQQQHLQQPAAAANAAEVAAAAQAAVQAAAAAAAEAQAAAVAADPAAAAAQAAVAQVQAAEQVGQAMAAAQAAGGQMLPEAQQQQLLAAAIAAVEQAGHAVAAAIAPVVVAAGGFIPAAQQQLQLIQQHHAQVAAAAAAAAVAAAAPPPLLPHLLPPPPPLVAAAAAAAAEAAAAAAADMGPAPGLGFVPVVPMVPPPPPEPPQAAAAAVAAAAAAAAGVLLPQLPCLTSLRRLTVGTTHGRLSSGVSLAALAPNLTCFEDLSELMRLPPAGADMLCGLTTLQHLTVNVDTLQQHARHSSLTGFTALSSNSSSSRDGGSGGSNGGGGDHQQHQQQQQHQEQQHQQQQNNKHQQQQSTAAPPAARNGSSSGGGDNSGVLATTTTVRWKTLAQLRSLRLLMLGHVHSEVIPCGSALPQLPGITRLELCSAFGGRPEYAETYTIAEDPLLWQSQVGVEELVVDGGVLLGGFLVDEGMAQLLRRQLTRLQRLVLCRCPDLKDEHVEWAVERRLAPVIVVVRDCPLVSEAAVVRLTAAAGGEVAVELVDADPADYEARSLTYAVDE